MLKVGYSQSSQTHPANNLSSSQTVIFFLLSPRPLITARMRTRTAGLHARLHGSRRIAYCSSSRRACLFIKFIILHGPWQGHAYTYNYKKNNTFESRCIDIDARRPSCRNTVGNEHQRGYPSSHHDT